MSANLKPINDPPIVGSGGSVSVVSSVPIEIDDTTPVDVNIGSTPIVIDDTTPIDVAITGTPSVTGTVAISGTPNVAITGTPSVTGTVAISGTPNVAITGTPSVTGTVAISGTPNVAITGTPNVAVSSAPVVEVINDAGTRLDVKPRQPATATHGTVTIATTATTLLAANANRHALVIRNVGANDVYYSTNSGVTLANGMLLKTDEVAVIEHIATVYAIADTSSSDVRYSEETY